MHHTSRLLFPLLLIALLASCSSIAPHSNDGAEERVVVARVRELLERYAAGDADGVVTLLDRRLFTMFGSDIKEIVRSEDELRKLMRDDFALWNKARFTDIRDMDIRIEGALATVYFVASFYVGDSSAAIPVRFATTWRKTNGTWLLTQSANAVPTVGQSAAEILRARQ